MIATLAGVSLAGILAAVTPTAVPAAPCSSDTFGIDGHAVLVRICAPAPGAVGEKGKPAPVQLRETFSTGGTSFERTVSLHSVDGAASSRTIDDVPLDKLGIAKTLHLTIGYKPGGVTLERALLVPGAVPLK
jgi:hypothetical protein